MTPKMERLMNAGTPLVWGLIGGLLGAALFAWSVPTAPQIATIDLQRLVEVARADLVKLATDKTLGESGAASIESRLSHFGVRLDAAVKAVGERHGAVILQSQAVATGSGVHDLTAEVERELHGGGE